MTISLSQIRLRVPLTAIVVGLVAVWLVSGYLGGKAVENNATIRGANAALAIGKAHRAKDSKLAAIARANADSAREWKRVAVIRGGLIRMLNTALSRSPTAAESLTVALQQRDTLKAQLTLWQAIANRWEIADRADSTRAAISEERNTVLEAQLIGVLAIAECHMLGVRWLPKCPSRTASFVLGGGIVGTLAILSR